MWACSIYVFLHVGMYVRIHIYDTCMFNNSKFIKAQTILKTVYIIIKACT